VIIAKGDLDGDIFCIHEAPAWILCTDSVKLFIQEKQFTNVGFLEVGDVL
jgi:hypothetical protein